MSDLVIRFKDLNTRQSSLEDIFVSLVSDREGRNLFQSFQSFQPFQLFQ